MSRCFGLAAFFAIFHGCVIAAGIEDAMDYKPAVPVATASTQPFTVNDFIAIAPSALNNKAVFDGSNLNYEKFWSDPRIVALDVSIFGECKSFYYSGYGSPSRSGIESALRFLFPRNEEQKVNASRGIRYSIEYLKNGNSGIPKCSNRDQYGEKTKAILDAIMQAGPAILAEKQRQIEAAAQQEAQIANKESAAIARSQADAAAKASQKSEVAAAAAVADAEAAKKLKACQSTREYQLFEVSSTIEQNNSREAAAQREIKQQEEGSKISGVVNKQIMYDNGQIIAKANRIKDENFVVYRKLGGLASRNDQVRQLPNPCR